ncbi:cob(I)yrinic acid a,c-diamide adenosyltransferase [Megalodesulfovibrio gigas]|uniref:corrinoid adenosyltransferase n=1 Tax=Megalodesulfovibrio gigas (strain ATCC 19364 / DSM 1382 / NCIMB 9332 / VKM B-1759) TaxID=1121448 RepID=T2GE78_MEGG1|nr:cob(I)yrinic acid a,c-diamide adenosyltransferase [Megalodesulfovibrio gigas]AGW14905.1 putative cob(I)yrinic acid a,c-diamide adenosyltransferase [Megalodesulfovibrio gigas DSM 1382 = ATCC 19364]
MNLESSPGPPDRPARPLVLVYTGDGKGKTSAALGQVVRALGHGHQVLFCQCMKRPDAAGEQRLLAALPGVDFLAGGLGFFRNEADRPRHRHAALDVLAWAADRLRRSPCFLLVVDEALYALDAGLVTREELESLLTLAGERGAHTVLTGRNCPPWLEERADLVSEVVCRKHPYAQGIPAVEGLDF